YKNPNESGSIDFTAATQAVFVQSFPPAINFNPTDSPACAPDGVDSRPFRDVSLNPDGSCKATIAQNSDKTEQAGVGDLSSFQAAFVTTITLPSAGKLTTSITADDGWVFCMGPNGHGDHPTPDPGNIMTNP